MTVAGIRKSGQLLGAFAALMLFATTAFSAPSPKPSIYPSPSPTPSYSPIPVPSSTVSEPFYYRRLIADTHFWRRKVGYDQCIENVKQFQCAYSPWKVLSLRERYEALLWIVKNRPMSGNFRTLENAVPCLMMRETGNFEPLTVSFKNCTRGAPPATDQGLGQVTFNTFCSILGLTEEETELALEGQKLSVERALQLNTISRIAPYNTLLYRMDPLMAFQAMSDNVDYSVDVALAVLRAKLARTQEVFNLGSSSGAKFNFGAQFFTVENYNGSDTKEEYAKAIMACKTCLDSDPKDPEHCLGLAIGVQDQEDFLPCDLKPGADFN
jgi:hypothetical protein